MTQIYNVSFDIKLVSVNLQHLLVCYSVQNEIKLWRKWRKASVHFLPRIMKNMEAYDPDKA